jgi:hypothetical protein
MKSNWIVIEGRCWRTTCCPPRLRSVRASRVLKMTCDLSAIYMKLLARWLARNCREIIQSCLREEEWLDAEDVRNGDFCGTSGSDFRAFDF